MRWSYFIGFDRSIPVIILNEFLFRRVVQDFLFRIESADIDIFLHLAGLLNTYLVSGFVSRKARREFSLVRNPLKLETQAYKDGCSAFVLSILRTADLAIPQNVSS